MDNTTGLHAGDHAIPISLAMPYDPLPVLSAFISYSPP